MNSHTHDEDPLDMLFADKEELDKSLLANAIFPYVRLYENTGDIVLTKEWDRLNLQQKLLVVMLARKALKIKEVIDNESVDHKQLEKITGIKGNSIRPTVGRLMDSRLVIRASEEAGTYFVPDYAVSRAYSLLVENEEDK